MLTERLKDKIIFTPDINGEYIKVIAKSDKDFVVLDSKFIKEEYTLKLTYIGEYFIYISGDGTFTEEPNEIFFYYDCLLEKVVEDYLSMACPCDDCGKDSPCSEKEVNKLLCLYDKVISLNYLLPQENATILNNLTKIYKDLLNKDILEGMTQSVYEGQSKCCSDLSLQNLGVNVLGLYYAYRKLLPNLLNDIDEIFQIQDLKECLKDSGLCLKDIINYFEEEYGPVINPPSFKGFTFTAEKEIGETTYTNSFKYSDFESQYIDPQGLPSNNIIIVQLPSAGFLYYQGIKISNTPFVVPRDFADGELYFEGELADEREKYSIDFYAKMTNSADLHSNVGKITGRILRVKNRPPTVGNNSMDIDTGETYVFTVEDFTTDTTPPYNDPEGNPADAIRIDKLPSTGRMLLEGSGRNPDVFEGQIISMDDIQDGKLKYTAPNTVMALREYFEFSVRDSGSMTFTKRTIFLDGTI